MSGSNLAKARRSQLVTTYGVGALFPAQNESFMVMGLDEWSDRQSPEVVEPRLARALGVATFRAPAAGGDRRRDVPVVRFPEWQFCPECRRLAPLRKFCAWNEHHCDDCGAELAPSRFVICCPRGHIDEFPYFAWLHAGNASDRSGVRHDMRLQARGRSSSLADIQLSCSCGVRPVSMEGSFEAGALRGMYGCAGRRPWLGAGSREPCDQLPRTLQRGSSNVWFPVVRSAISIPPWSEGAYRLIDRHWRVLQAVPVDAVRATLDGMELATDGYKIDDLIEAVIRRRGEESEQPGDESDADLRSEEYKALVAGRSERSREQDFVCDRVDVSPVLAGWIAQVSRVSRLREVRALQAFTRLLPPSFDTPADHYAPLSLDGKSWLPALEVSGEGIFLRLDEDALRRWEDGPFAMRRAQLLQRSVDRRVADRGLAAVPVVSARELLLHSLAHALIEQLSLDGGYPSASLRERVYSGDSTAGVLIYTATSDSAGSLGGVTSQSAEARFENAILSALARLSWCSSDPVCIESTAAGVDALNLAACHACLLLPETSCERGNTFLDRALLLGDPDHFHDGFFSELLRTR